MAPSVSEKPQRQPRSHQIKIQPRYLIILSYAPTYRFSRWDCTDRSCLRTWARDIHWRYYCTDDSASRATDSTAVLSSARFQDSVTRASRHWKRRRRYCSITIINNWVNRSWLFCKQTRKLTLPFDSSCSSSRPVAAAAAEDCCRQDAAGPERQALTEAPVPRARF